MSLPSNEKGQNFEILYNSLKNEYEQVINDNDEICKEYESTIELLKTTLDKTQQEKEKLQNKNKEKLIDIQDLTKLNDKLKEDIKKINEEKKLKESKIVFLENDNEHYLNKIRQSEAIIDDLNTQLESALEENITLQTEFEIYKQNTSEELMRKDEELQDCKSDIVNKEKIIQQLNTKKIMRELEEKMKMTTESLKKIQRKYSEYQFEKEKNKDKNNLENSVSNFNINRSVNENNIYKTEIKNKNDLNNGLVTPIFNNKVLIPTKFEEIYRKSVKNIEKIATPTKFEENDNKKVENKNKKVTFNLDKNNCNSCNCHLDSQDSSNKELKINNNNNNNEIEKEEKILKDDFEHDDSSSCFSSEKKIFEDLVICNEKLFSINSIKNLVKDKLMKNQKLKDNLKKLLKLTQQRKSNLINRKLNIRERLDKLKYKISDIF